MSTRAVYTFKDHTGTFHVYGHRDGYPEGAVSYIKAAFETGSIRANDLAVSFIVANKMCGELIPHYDAYIDLDYRYEITKNKKGNFIISAFERTPGFYDAPKYGLIFRGSLDEFEEFVEKSRLEWENLHVLK